MIQRQEVYTLIKLALLFEPKLLIGAGVFIEDKYLDMDNRFFEVTDQNMNIHANERIVIGGITTKVLNIMTFKPNFLLNFYYSPILRLTKPKKPAPDPIDSNNYKKNSPNSNKKTYPIRKKREEGCCIIF